MSLTRRSRSIPAARELSSGDPELPSLKGIQVFIVDDEPDARELLRRVLEGQGEVVSAFESVSAAPSTLKQSRPDVIVSDIGMPPWTDISSCELCAPLSRVTNTSALWIGRRPHRELIRHKQSHPARCQRITGR